MHHTTKPAATLFVAFGFILFAAQAAANGRSMTIESPDGRLKVEFGVARSGEVFYLANWRDEPLIKQSAIGLGHAGDKPISPKLSRGNYRYTYETWSPIVGKRREILNRCHELTIELTRANGALRRVELIVRAYDNGFAFRWRVPPENTPSPRPTFNLHESVAFRLASDPALWSYRKEQAPAGPVKLSEATGKVAIPVLVDRDDAGYAALLEADVRNAGWLELEAKDGALSTVYREHKAPAGWQSPWRVIQVGESLADLVDSDLLANLNPKADPEQFAWVKPGVALWDWRSWGYTAPDGFKFGLNLESWKRFIDFAAEHEIPYLLLDANWYGPEFEKTSNPFTGGVAGDVRRAIAYGKERGVGLILYLNDVAAREHGIEEILREWSDWGAAGIKYGFMRAREPAAKVAWTREIVRLCAENKLLVNFHDGPVPPAGCEATYPNWVTREFCHAQSDAKRAFTPTTFLMQMAVNQLAGPIDMNNGMFDLNRSVAERPRVFVEVPATITAEAARTLIVYSGMTVIPDATPAYERHPELFRFIAAQKMPWTESKTLAFELGKHITVMRQTGDTYLVGSATNEQARTLSIPLDFLPAGKKFIALVCGDAPGAHYTDNREAYTTKTIKVDSTTVVGARLAPGGGHCLLIEPAE